ncbi:amidase domain-containing protein [Geobacillus sp. FSL W8-0032]|uniref:Putative amidase domain-containing protein n=1 Tax=Geobacillus icigianus TaxID=1430331 RepID=A0ABU6BJU6_9BACL|nr:MULTISPECIES: amidase domain-containing protein [Geobacillus]KYD26265.1 hypothetical protein B4113_1260 [Geobacillus sp. B4113_201601]MEB3752155.1 hypothetical protein [Geobacillus icigianus]
MKQRLRERLNERARSFVSGNGLKDEEITRKQKLCQKRGVEIVRCSIRGQIVGRQTVERETKLVYVAHHQFLLKQGDILYVEEQVEERCARFVNGEWVADDRISRTGGNVEAPRVEREQWRGERLSYQYDRAQAVRYAETWWNRHNPAFPSFPVDCTNFVSQCLYAGGVPMTGYPNRARGWWCQNGSWSYSWAVAHSLRWYLSGSRIGLQAVEVSEPGQLMAGDVICYDFQGDGRFDHSAIVVAKDQEGMPLVNAHTTNSRMRYWSYEDSSAYTPNIRYKFFHIMDRK